MDRRAFLKVSLVGAGAAAALSVRGPQASAEEPPAAKPQAVLKLCSQEWRIPGGSVKEKAENILKFGGVALEFGGMDVARAKQVRKDLEAAGVGMGPLCVGYFPLIDPDPEKRKEGVENLKKMLEAAGEAGCHGRHRRARLQPAPATGVR